MEDVKKPTEKQRFEAGPLVTLPLMPNDKHAFTITPLQPSGKAAFPLLLIVFGSILLTIGCVSTITSIYLVATLNSKNYAIASLLCSMSIIPVALLITVSSYCVKIRQPPAMILAPMIIVLAVISWAVNLEGTTNIVYTCKGMPGCAVKMKVGSSNMKVGISNNTEINNSSVIQHCFQKGDFIEFTKDHPYEMKWKLIYTCDKTCANVIDHHKVLAWNSAAEGLLVLILSCIACFYPGHVSKKTAAVPMNTILGNDNKKISVWVTEVMNMPQATD